MENIWDHVAGSIVFEAPGGGVADRRGRPLKFGRGRKLENVEGIVVTNSAKHGAVISAAHEALQESTAECLRWM